MDSPAWFMACHSRFVAIEARFCSEDSSQLRIGSTGKGFMGRNKKDDGRGDGFQMSQADEASFAPFSRQGPPR